MPSALSFKLENNKLPTLGLMRPQRKATTTKLLLTKAKVIMRGELKRSSWAWKQTGWTWEAAFNRACYFINYLLRGGVEVCDYVCSSFFFNKLIFIQIFF